ncbi:hypothetical protein ACVW0K_007419 [Streptomyces filamentosus]
MTATAAAPAVPSFELHERVKTALLHCWMARVAAGAEGTPGDHCDALATAALVAVWEPPAPARNRPIEQDPCTAAATTADGALLRACALDEDHTGWHVDYDGTQWTPRPADDEEPTA